MRVPVSLEAEGYVAEPTAERFIASMTSHMVDKLTLTTELFHTKVASRLSLHIVHHLWL
jgi:hypothetical protein